MDFYTPNDRRIFETIKKALLRMKQGFCFGGDGGN